MNDYLFPLKDRLLTSRDVNQELFQLDEILTCFQKEGTGHRDVPLTETNDDPHPETFITTS